MTMSAMMIGIRNDIMMEPAVPDQQYAFKEVYFVQDGEVVGIGKFAGGVDHRYEYLPADEAAKELFKGDEILASLGRHGGLQYDRYSGKPVSRFSDEPGDRHKGTVVISKAHVDLGMIPKWFGEVRLPLTMQSDGAVSG